mgnify:CR=1 FL=1
MNTTSKIDILFDCYYFNLAWGLSIYGFFISVEGDVCRYGIQKGKNLPEFISIDGTFREFIDACRRDFSVIDKVDSQELSEHASLIEAASLGEVERSIGSFDGGSTIFLAYTTAGDERRVVILQQFGDAIATNQSPETETLVKWLDGYWSKVENMYLSEFYPK